MTKEKELYHKGADFQFEHEEILLGAPSSYSLTHDPKHLAFVLSRYKFCAKMLQGKKKILEMINPEIICHIPHHAVTIAIPPCPSKKLKIIINPNPEFCIPVSIVIDLMSSGVFRNDLLKKNPVANAIPL